MKKILSILMVAMLMIALCACGGITSQQDAEDAICKEIYSKVSSGIEEITFETVTKGEDGRWEAEGKLAIKKGDTTYSGDFSATIIGEEVQVESSVISQAQRVENLERMEEMKDKYFN